MKIYFKIYIVLTLIILAVAAYFAEQYLWELKAHPPKHTSADEEKVIEEFEKDIPQKDTNIELTNKKGDEFEVLSQTEMNEVGYAQRIRSRGLDFDAILINLKRVQPRFFLKKSDGTHFQSFWTLKKHIEKQSNQKLCFATNGGIYQSGFNPEGLYIEDGKVIKPINLKSAKGNFYMQPNGVFLLTHDGEAKILSSQDYLNQNEKAVKYATQSGPMLLINDKINPKFRANSRSRFIRNGVGLINPYQAVFVISNQKVNFYQFARIFKEYFRCKNALYLDGAISKMYLPQLHRYQLDGDFGVIIGITQ